MIHKVSQEKNLGDISKVDEKDLADFDLLTYGFPCQDISVAGKAAGIIKGQTRSGLLYEALRIIKHKKPKYAICENVKNLVGKRFKDDFDQLLAELESYGYRNYWKVLNAKNYGIPQNREFEFPQNVPLKLCLGDMLESEVDEKFYLSKQIIDTFTKHKERHESKGNGFKFEPFTDTKTVAHCINTRQGSWPTDNYIVEPKIKQVCNIAETGNFSNPQRGRIYSSSGISPCLTTCQGGGLEPKIMFNERIRKLTPKECLRLMGFTDNDYRIIADAKISNTQIYKMAGNSIVIPVLEGIFTNLLKGKIS